MTPFIPFTPAHSLSLRCDAKVSTISTPPIYVRSLQLPGDELSNLPGDEERNKEGMERWSNDFSQTLGKCTDSEARIASWA